MQPEFHSSPFPTLLTLHDGITDSPVFRVNLAQTYEQLDILEEWLSSLSAHLRQYIEKLNKLKSDTLLVCEKAMPPRKVDSQFLVPGFNGEAVRRFSDAWQASLSSHTNLLSELQTDLVEPLESFVEKRIKNLKDHRKQYERALDNYESQLQKYVSLSRSKDNTVLVSEQMRLYECRKEYLRQSSQQILEIATLRGDLVNAVIESLSKMAAVTDKPNHCACIWQDMHSALLNWKKWLIDDQKTCAFELELLQKKQQALENEYMQIIRPRQGSTLSCLARASDYRHQAAYTGYLFLRVSRRSWQRRWCLSVHTYFIWCRTTVRSGKPVIVFEGKLNVADCNTRKVTDGDRRFCMEFTYKQKSTFLFQAETDSELSDWLIRLEEAKQLQDNGSSIISSLGYRESLETVSIMDSIQPSSPSFESSPMEIGSLGPGSPVRLFPKAKSTTTVTTPKEISVTLSTTPRSSASDLSSLSDASGSRSQSQISMPTALKTGASVVSYYSNASSLAGGISLNPSIALEAIRAEIGSKDTMVHSSWGAPWPLLDSMLLRRSLPGSSSLPSAEPLQVPEVVWPPSSSCSQVPAIDIADYPNSLQEANLRLRQLFGGVGNQEVVLDVFDALLWEKPEQSADVSGVPVPSTSKGYGLGYTGNAFVTQDAFWFYSCILTTCVKTVTLKLKDIKSVELIVNNSQQTDRGSALFISLQIGSCVPNETAVDEVVLSCPTENVGIIAEKLRFAVRNAQNSEPMQLFDLYEKICSFAQEQALLYPDSELAKVHGTKKQQLSFRTLAATRPTVILKDLKDVKDAHQDSQNGTVEDGNTKPKAMESIRQLKENPSTQLLDPDEIPKEVAVPSGEITCGCDDHLDKLEAEIELPISAKRLFELMFTDEYNAPPAKGGVWESKTAATAGYDLRVGRWETVDNIMQRTLKYIMPVANPIVRIKEAEVVETQVLLTKDDYIRYVVQISTRTAALPYADAFIPSVRYCITYVDKSRCKLAFYLGVRWVKSVFVRAIVTKAAMKGMGDSVQLFIPILQDAAGRIESDVNAQRLASGRQDEEKSMTPNKADLDPRKADIRDSSLTNLNNGRGQTSHATSAEQMAQATTSTVRKDVEPHKPIGRSTAYAANRTRKPTSTSSNSHGHSSTTLRSSIVRHKQKYERRVDPIRVLLLIILCFCGLYAPWKMWTYWYDTASPKPAENGLAQGLSALLPSSSVIETGSDDRNAIIAKAVYLRDLEEGILFPKARSQYSASASFQRFVRSTGLDSGTTREEEPYQWFSSQCRRLATDIGSSRDRLAVLRHELLMLFNMLNRMDSELLEHEYVNWLLDGRSRCDYNTRLLHSETNNNSMITEQCQEIVYHLHTYFNDQRSDF